MEINNSYHIPVLLHAAVDGLNIKSDEIYVDLTYGGGGHSAEILSKLSKKGRLLAFDQDKDSLRNLREEDNIEFINQNFRFLKNQLRMNSAFPASGILADLGVSSHQFDTSERGFSFRFESVLDMRMNKDSGLSAVDVLNDYSHSQLLRVFKIYGELREARRITDRIIDSRKESKIIYSKQLLGLLDNMVPGKKINQFYARIFQAIRIEVNSEMQVLEELLNQLSDAVKIGGRIVFITYHSLEDRMLKNYIKSGNIEGKVDKDFYGNVIKPFKAINRKPIIPSEKELKDNSRARSAKMRIAERI
jgi:16S rRNA (cytosine1402-N4)-methyltransferase